MGRLHQTRCGTYPIIKHRYLSGSPHRAFRATNSQARAVRLVRPDPANASRNDPQNKVTTGPRRALRLACPSDDGRGGKHGTRQATNFLILPCHDPPHIGRPLMVFPFRRDQTRAGLGSGGWGQREGWSRAGYPRFKERSAGEWMGEGKEGKKRSGRSKKKTAVMLSCETKWGKALVVGVTGARSGSCHSTVSCSSRDVDDWGVGGAGGEHRGPALSRPGLAQPQRPA